MEKKIDNMIWHIKENRDVLGDKRTLDDILQSLNRMSKELKEECANERVVKGW